MWGSSADLVSVGHLHGSMQPNHSVCSYMQIYTYQERGADKQVVGTDFHWTQEWGISGGNHCSHRGRTGGLGRGDGGSQPIDCQACRDGRHAFSTDPLDCSQGPGRCHD